MDAGSIEAVSPQLPRSRDVTGDAEQVPDEARAAAADALREAFTRLQPQGSDSWNFLGAFTHLIELSELLHPVSSAAPDPSLAADDATPQTADLTPDMADRMSDKADQIDPDEAGPTRRAITPDRIRRFMDRGVEIEVAKAEIRQTKADLEHTSAVLARTTAELGHDKAELVQTRAELGQAVAHIVEAFRFLSARVETLEARIAAEDRPIDGVAGLAPARELGRWAEPIAAHVVDRTPGGDILHADCGDGALVAAIEAAGAPAQGVEPRGNVALHALEHGCRVSICEALDHLSTRASRSLGGIVLSGVVDRLSVAGVVPLLAHCRRTLAAGAPLVVMAEPRGTGPTSASPVSEIVPGAPLLASTWEMLLERTGFAGVVPLSAPAAASGDTRLVVVAAAPS
jgi:hypothetical protein